MTGLATAGSICIIRSSQEFPIDVDHPLHDEEQRRVAGYTITPPAAPRTCAAPAAANTDQSGVRLVCPAPGSQIRDVVRIVVAAPPSSRVTATAWATAPRTTRNPALSVVAEATAYATGYAVLDVDSRRLLRGPATLRIAAAGAARPVYVQLFNPAGRAEKATTPQQSNSMTLAWSEEFRSPLSISRSGEKAVYAATEPSYGGQSEFGSAVFADPAWGTGNLGTIGGDHLRIRVNDRPPNRPDPLGYNRPHVGGMLSSGAVGGSGFSAQYGYFEARILGAPGRGTWPAFWALSSRNLVEPSTTTGEVDTDEPYFFMLKLAMGGGWPTDLSNTSGISDLYVDPRSRLHLSA